jgi:hypothetical protein
VCPDQMLFGSEDWRTCVQLHLLLYLEGWLQLHPNALHMFTENDDDELDPKNLNKQYGNRVKAVCWNNPEFKALEDQTRPDQKRLGTHSNRKYASTRANRRGGRYKRASSVQRKMDNGNEQFHRNQAVHLAETERLKHGFAMNFDEGDVNPLVKVLLEVFNVDGRLEVVPVTNNDVIANNANNTADNDENNGNHRDNNEQEPQQQQQQQRQR